MIFGKVGGRKLILIEIISESLEKTENIGKAIASKLSGTEVIALFGELGAGKTALTRGICQGLNIKDNVCSPTFAIVNEYSGKYKVYHFDMYRVNGIDDLSSTGYFDYLNTGILIIEWSENIKEFLPDDAIKVTIKYSGVENERMLIFEGVEGIDV